MKKICIIVLCFIILICVCGCDMHNKVLNDNSKEDNIDNNEESGYTEEKVVCNALKDIKSGVFIGSFSDGYFYTNNNDVYAFSTQIFSNNTNCLKLNNDNIKVERRLDDTSFIATDGYIYGILKTEITKGPKADMNKDNDNVFTTFFTKKYALKIDGKIYKYVDDSWVLYREIPNEKVIDFYIDELNKFEYIKTDKSFYSLKAINKEECNKYIDIECEYKLEKNEKLSSIYNDIAILLVNDTGDAYYTKDGNLYPPVN